MMKHLNKYLSLALALVLCLSLAACGAMASTGIKICFHRFFMVLLPFHHSIM